LVCSNFNGQNLDLTKDQIIYLLQPTRIIDRKRIEKNWHLIGSLLKYPPFLHEFEINKKRQIILHISGPVPIEHQTDLEIILKTFIDVINQVPKIIKDRLFLAFSIGTNEHSSFRKNKFKKITIKDIYHLATMVVFPSLTEGRGLPIIESSAAGVPIVCSRYQPEETFADVVGEGLSKDQQINYIQFPENDFSQSFLDKVSKLLLNPEGWNQNKKHNIRVVRQRYGSEAMNNNFKKYLDELLNSK
jgi:glycosyltransferase involved in cell wall biosynthesis